jgi:hypothetical protein
MSVISKSFKRNAASKLVSSMKIVNKDEEERVIEAWTKGFDLAESMFTEQV